jgi:four helix bundle protein
MDYRSQDLLSLHDDLPQSQGHFSGTPSARLNRMTRGVKRFTDLRAWQACDVFKKAVYRLCENVEIAKDIGRRKQIEESSSGPTAHIAEGFGRFNPADFARFCVMARSSLMESQNHWLDFVDKRYITHDVRLEVNQLAETALEEVTGLMEYLQSPEALRNARRARERRIASRPQRRSENKEPRPKAKTPRTQNQTENRTKNPEPNRESEHEQRTEKAEE